MSVEEIGYNITVSRQTASTGEVVSIVTNAPKDATQDELAAKVIMIADVMQRRMEHMNKEVLARTGKTLKELGIEIGE
jgi:hypothetical protein